MDRSWSEYTTVCVCVLCMRFGGYLCSCAAAKAYPVYTCVTCILYTYMIYGDV